MTDRTPFKTRLTEALATLALGDLAGARSQLDQLRADPRAQTMGQQTVLGMPRQLHAAYLKLAKAERDPIARIGLQYALVPDPVVLARFADLSSDQRRATALADRQPVPQVIHQIWIGPRPPPATTTAWAHHAERQGYGYRLWREADLRDLGVDADPVYHAMMARGDFPGAVDIARYILLREQGGIYLDCDWYPARNDIGFHDRLPLIGLTVLAEDTPRQTGFGSLLLSNAFIAAPPLHPAFDRLLAALPSVQAELPRAPAWWTTGPLIFTLICRGGAVTVADAGFVAGKADGCVTPDAIAALCADVQARDGGMLLAWKPWGS